MIENFRNIHLQKSYLFYLTIPNLKYDISYLIKNINVFIENGKWKMKFSMIYDKNLKDLNKCLEKLSYNDNDYYIQLINNDGVTSDSCFTFYGKLKCYIKFDYSINDYLYLECEVY